MIMLKKIKNWIIKDTCDKMFIAVIILMVISAVVQSVILFTILYDDRKVPVHVKCYINRTLAYDGTATKIVKETYKRLHFIEAETNKLILIMDKGNCILEYENKGELNGRK